MQTTYLLMLELFVSTTTNNHHLPLIKPETNTRHMVAATVTNRCQDIAFIFHSVNNVALQLNNRSQNCCTLVVIKYDLAYV